MSITDTLCHKIKFCSHIKKLPRFVDSARLRLALFRPCHPECSRNPSEARIEWYEVPFGISVGKVRLAMLAQNDRAGASRKVGIPLSETLERGDLSE